MNLYAWTRDAAGNILDVRDPLAQEDEQLKTLELFEKVPVDDNPWTRRAVIFLCSQIDGLEARIRELESSHAAASVDRDTEAEQELGRELREAHERIAQWNAHALVQRGRIKALEGDLGRANATIGHLEETARLLTEQRDEARKRLILDVSINAPSVTPDRISTERAPAGAEPGNGWYRHWKGKRYYVACVVTHTESNERLVVYVSHESPTTWARPLRSWNAPVRRPDGSIRPRFVRDEAQKFIHQEPKETESTEEPILGATYVNWVGGKCKVECIARRSDAIALLGGWERVVVYRYRKTDDPIVCALSFWNEIVDRSDGTRGPRFVREP